MQWGKPLWNLMGVDKWLQSSWDAAHGLALRNREEEWNNNHIWKSAPDIKSMFYGFEYIVELDWIKVLEPNKVSGWQPKEDVCKQFCFPFRELGDHTVFYNARGTYNEHTIFEFNEIGGGDTLFAATNNAEDATFLVLKYK